MAKLTGPLFSIGATGSIGDNLSIRYKDKLHVAQKYNKPGDKVPFESSPKQKDQRGIIGLIDIYWQCMTPAVKLTWNNLAKSLKQPITGYSYFIRMAQTNLLLYLGLVGYWSFNYNVGNQVYDLSGNGNHGILSPSYPSNCPTLDSSINSKFGQALFSNGSGGYVNCGNNISLKLPLFSLELWFKATSLISTWSNLFYKELGPSSRNYMLYIYKPNSSLVMALSVAGVQHDVRLTFGVIDSIWHYVACTLNSSGSLTTYFDGLLKNVTELGGPADTQNTDLLIAPFETTAPISFLIDEFRLYNRVLSLTEILLHYKLFR